MRLLRGRLPLWGVGDGGKYLMIPLKIPHLLRCFDFLVIAKYVKYASFPGNLAPCI